MYLTCLDLEGVLTPEIWIAVAEASGIAELRLTTRDISDYGALMRGRINVLRAHSLTLRAVQDIIGGILPLEGARAFLDELRCLCQVIILSDTFSQFALPLMRRLGMPAIFCNTLEVGADGMITGYRMRQENGKYCAVKAFKSLGFRTIAAGDSYNDLAMLREADAGFLFRPPRRIAAENPAIPSFTAYAELLAAIKTLLQAENPSPGGMTA